MKKRLANFSSSWVKFITLDYGKEFAHHDGLAKDLNVKIYFTRKTLYLTGQRNGRKQNRHYQKIFSKENRPESNNRKENKRSRIITKLQIHEKV